MVTALLVIGLILLFILCLFIALLCVPMRLRLTVRKATPVLRIYLFGIPFFRYPKAKKPSLGKPSAQQKKKQQDASVGKHLLPNAKILDTKDAKQTIEQIAAFLKELTAFTRQSKATLHSLQLTPPPTEDAADAALLYTALSGACAGVLEILDQNTRLLIKRADSVRIEPNYTNKEADLRLDLSFSFPPYRAVTVLAPLTELLQKI